MEVKRPYKKNKQLPLVNNRVLGKTFQDKKSRAAEYHEISATRLSS